MMEELMKTELLMIINSKRNKTLPEWTAPVEVYVEDTNEKVFDIIDTKPVDGSMFVAQGWGQASYFNGSGDNSYHLCFIGYEKFLNQFCISRYDENGRRTTTDWAKGIDRPDYMCYTVGVNKYFIVHELSEGSVKNKRPKAKSQLVNCLLMLKKSQKIMDCLNLYESRLCILSAQGCVEASPMGMADGFNEIYNNIPDPVPLKCATLERLGFEAYETKAVKLV